MTFKVTREDELAGRGELVSTPIHRVRSGRTIIRIARRASFEGNQRSSMGDIAEEFQRNDDASPARNFPLFGLSLPAAAGYPKSC